MSDAQQENDEAGARSEFAEEAARKNQSLFREYLAFLRQGRKWYLGPILFLLLIAGIFVMVGGTVAAPLIYALF